MSQGTRRIAFGRSLLTCAYFIRRLLPSSLQTWQNNTNPCWWKDPGLRKNGAYSNSMPALDNARRSRLSPAVACVAIILNAVFTFGYDGSLLNAHQGMPAWQSFFNHPIGSDLGLISASYVRQAPLSLPRSPS